MIEFVSEPNVELIDKMGSDHTVVRAARVSLANDETVATTEEATGLINYLMKHRHGSPFEHATLTFRVETPIFVAREFFRHRAGWSYNEVSGRFTQLQGRFYAPSTERPIKQTGPASRPTFEADPDLACKASDELRDIYYSCWDFYTHLLSIGVPNEVARMCLPVGTMTTFYATCNLRSLMHFLGLRTYVEGESADRSYPQYEIQQVAFKMEELATEHYPIVMEAFKKNGRKAP